MKIEGRKDDTRQPEIPRSGEKLKLSLPDFKVSMMQLHVRKFRDLGPRESSDINGSLVRGCIVEHDVESPNIKLGKGNFLRRIVEKQSI